MGDQLSFEDVLFEKERNLLYMTSKVNTALQSLHFERTRTTATLAHSKSPRYRQSLLHVKKSLTNSLEWLSQIIYFLTKELSEISQVAPKEKTWYHAALASDVLVIEARTTPFDIYNGYIRIYKGVSSLFTEYEGVFDEVRPCPTLIKEFYVDMQSAGEELEEIL
jgi:hypothetical protein